MDIFEMEENYEKMDNDIIIYNYFRDFFENSR